MSFFAELKRRNVFRVGIAYVVGAWLLIQVADIVFETIGSPPLVMQTLLAVLAIGLPVALFFAWAFELTPEGVKREKEVDRSQSIAPQTGKKLNNTILVLMALAIGYLLFDKFSAPTQPGSDHFSQQSSSQTTGPGEKSALTPVEAIAQASNKEKPTIHRQSIAVLPFDNRSDQKSDEYFVEGMHDDLLTNLARIGSLKVISRTSMTRYKDTEKSIPEIATELGVATIMEGAVQRSGNQVRINVQLIDAQTDEHLWAEIFDRELTANNLFAIQSEISEAIAKALQATLSPAEQKRINQLPTENLAAYNAFLRGRQFMARRSSQDLQSARREFERAVELDSGYALAWVAVADVNMLLSQYSTIDHGELMARQESAVEKALAIDDELGEAHVALANIRNNQGLTEEADPAFRRGIELSPNYVAGHQWYGSFLSQAVDRLDEAVRQLDKAVELDPLSSIVQANRYDALVRQGDFERAEAQIRQLQRTDPDFVPTLLRLGGFPTDRRLPLDKAIPNLRKARDLDPGNPLYPWLEGRAYISLGDLDAATTILRHLEDINRDHWSAMVVASLLALRTNDLASAHELALRAAGSPSYALNFNKDLIDTAVLQRDYQRALGYLKEAWPDWQDASRWAQWLPRNTGLACNAGWTLMQAGDETLGRALLEQARDFMLNTAPRHMKRPGRLPVSDCLAALGDRAGALDQLEATLEFDYSFDSWQTGLGPMFDELHDEPRFVAVMGELEKRRNEQRANLDRMRAEDRR